jgi:hypothetical protein
VFIIGIVLIHRKGEVSYGAILLDVLCYCGGVTLVNFACLLLFARYRARSWAEESQKAFLGRYAAIPLWVLILVALIGCLLFAGRAWQRMQKKAANEKPKETDESA